VKLILSSIQLQVPGSDPSTWDGIVRTAFGLDMPAAADWIADGTPKSQDDVVTAATGT
jgi:hypothetical protein